MSQKDLFVVKHWQLIRFMYNFDNYIEIYIENFFTETYKYTKFPDAIIWITLFIFLVKYLKMYWHF